MPIKKVKPTTPGRRGMSFVDYSGLTKTKPQKRLTKGTKNKAGRGSSGTITVRRRGGGASRKFRKIDFDRSQKLNIPGKVASIEYDPNRSAFIMLVQYPDGDKRYHLAPDGVKVGTKIVTGHKTKIKTGNRMLIDNIPVGYSIYNIELNKGKGGQMTRSAGSYAKLVSLDTEKAQIQLPSGEIRLVPKNCFASIGRVSNIDHNQVVIGKAGRNRWKRKRPKVRGKAMNPCDHPHGGGEGGSPIGMKHPKTPWGMPALGYKTRKRKFTNKFIIKDRRDSKK